MIQLSAPEGYQSATAGQPYDYSSRHTYLARCRAVRTNLSAVLNELVESTERAPMFAPKPSQSHLFVGAPDSDPLQQLFQLVGEREREKQEQDIAYVERTWRLKCITGSPSNSKGVPPRLFNYDNTPDTVRSIKNEQANLGLPITNDNPLMSGHAFVNASGITERSKNKTTAGDLGRVIVTPEQPSEKDGDLAPGGTEDHPIYPLGAAHMVTITRLLSTGDDAERRGQLNWSDITNVRESHILRYRAETYCIAHAQAELQVTQHKICMETLTDLCTQDRRSWWFCRALRSAWRHRSSYLPPSTSSRNVNWSYTI
jgi:hypothetical protein